MRKRLLIITLAWFATHLYAQTDKKNDKPAKEIQRTNFDAYAIFDKNGKKTDFATAIKTILKSEVVFFGELHDNPISHWLQLQLVKEAYKVKKDKLMLSAEMFEADQQPLMDEYLAGIISQKSFEEEMRLWKNYKTDYKPLLDFARDNKLKFICANIPRRYASLVYKKGLEMLDSLTEEAKKYIAPLPVKFDAELKCYKDILQNAAGHGGDNLAKAQAIKDATMAWMITKNYIKDNFLIHLNGAYHSDFNEGTMWYLKQYYPALKTINITTVLQEDVTKLLPEHKNRADYIIVVPTDMCNTH
jgi:uncharacterized iron-regulated protein